MASRKREVLHCPECNHGNKLSKVQDFYRCGECKNEWFDYEMIKIPFRTIKFEGRDGTPKYLPLTPKVLADWKGRNAGFYSSEFEKHKFKKGCNMTNEQVQNAKSIGRAKKGWRGRRDENLLRRLKKK
tara:strand:+ start:3315 stop:3698 length:384 start_codon:yes stop_codon:yes gene_type:complete